MAKRQEIVKWESLANFDLFNNAHHNGDSFIKLKTESNSRLLKDIPTKTIILERGELQIGEATTAVVH